METVINGTPLSDLFDWFLLKITDIDFLSFSDDNREITLRKYTRLACVMFEDYVDSCKLDINKENTSFINTLSNKELDILSDLMIISWLQPKLNHYKNLENIMNTSDFQQYSPANMLKNMREYYAELNQELRLKMNEYTFSRHKLEDLKK